MYGKIINLTKKLWIKIGNLSKNMCIMIKFNKNTPNI